MKFTTLKIENFLAIGSATIDLADRGLMLVTGENDDPSAVSNGAGKSSLADALCWALYGVTARGVTGDDVITNSIGNNTRVSIRLVDEKDTYLVVRHRKHAKNKNSLQVFSILPTGDKVDLSKGTDKMTQETVNKIVGCSYDVFRSAVYAGQEQMPDLPAMTDKQLKLLVEEAAGTQILDAAYAEARNRVLEAENADKEATYNLKQAQAALSDAKDSLATTIENGENWKGIRKVAIEEKSVKYALKIDGQKSAKKTYELREKDRPAIETKLEDLKNIKSVIHKEEKQQSDLERALISATRAVSNTQAQKDAVKEQYQKAKADYEKIDHQLGCPCSSCSRPITEKELAPLKENSEKLLQSLKLKFAKLKAELDSAQTLENEAQSALDVFKASRVDMSAKLAEIASLRDELQSIDKVKEEYLAAVRECDRANAEYENAKNAENPYEALIEKLAKREQVCLENIKIAEKEIEAQSAKLQILKDARDVFSPAGVRAHILDEVTPFLNEQTAKYLGILSDGTINANWTTLTRTAKGELREKFTIEVESERGGKSFASISGGEKRKVRIATALALQDLVARRATKPLDLFIGDEIDDALDSAGLERLMSVLEEKATERGTIMVISHASLRDWISNIVTMKKVGTVSTMIESVI